MPSGLGIFHLLMQPIVLRVLPSLLVLLFITVSYLSVSCFYQEVFGIALSSPVFVMAGRLSYDDLVKQVDPPPLDAQLLSDEKLQQCLNILNAALSTQKSTKILQDELAALTASTLVLDRTFDQVQMLFNTLVYEAEDPTFKENIQKLSQTWKDHHKAYNDILWSGRNLAGTARGIVDDFSETLYEIVTDESTSADEAKKYFTSTISMIDKKSEGFEPLRSMIKQLGVILKGFMADWRDTIAKSRLKLRQHKITGLDKDIAKLTQTLEDLQTQMKDLASQMGVLQGQENVGTIIAVLEPGHFEYTTPVVLAQHSISALQGSVDTNEAGLALQGLVRQDIETRHALEDQRAERDKIEATLPAHDAVDVVLSGQDLYVNAVSSRLLAIASVFKILRTDMTSLISIVDSAKSTPEDDSAQSGDTAWMLFKLRMETMKSLYESLSEALGQYENAVVPPENKAKA